MTACCCTATAAAADDVGVPCFSPSCAVPSVVAGPVSASPALAVADSDDAVWLSSATEAPRSTSDRLGTDHTERTSPLTERQSQATMRGTATRLLRRLCLQRHLFTRTHTQRQSPYVASAWRKSVSHKRCVCKCQSQREDLCIAHIRKRANAQISAVEQAGVYKTENEK